MEEKYNQIDPNNLQHYVEEDFIPSLEEERIKLGTLNYTLTEEDRLSNGKFRIPQSDLIPRKCWGMTIGTKTFSCSGEDIKIIK